MRVKIFRGTNDNAALANSINTWLAANPNAHIESITQSQSGTALDETVNIRITISIFYTEEIE
jgi:hypothetical protein